MSGRTSALLRPQPWWLRVTGAGLLALAVFSVSLAMRLPEYGSTYLLMIPTVVIAAHLAGRDAGIAATAVAAAAFGTRILLNWSTVPHSVVHLASLGVFVAIGIGISVLFSRLKRALRDLEVANMRLVEANEMARSAGEETDLLLRELRHRVRNDLSNLIAILRLQAKTLDGDTAKPLIAAADRLQVLAKVHQRLSRQGHSPIVDMKGFIEELCGELKATLLPLKPVALETHVDEFSLPSTRAVSVGLIVNELVTNAMKYAYPDSLEGTICVHVTCEDDVVEVAVEDDGIGMSEDRCGEDGGGLGHRLVRSLAAQLSGRFTCEVDPPGTTCIVAFPKEAPIQRRANSGVLA